MNLILEKEKIKKEIDLIDDARIIKAIKKLLAGYEVIDTPIGMLNEPPLTDEEMAIPEGHTPTRAQIKEWLDKEDEDEFLTGDEALKYSLHMYEELKGKKKKK